MSSNHLLNIQVSEIGCIIKRQRMLVYLSSMTLENCGHCHGMGQPVTYPPISIVSINTAPNLKFCLQTFPEDQCTSSLEHHPSACKYVAPPSPSWGNPAISPDLGWHLDQSTRSDISWFTNICSSLQEHSSELIRNKSPPAAGIPEDACYFESHPVIAGSGGGKRK